MPDESDHLTNCISSSRTKIALITTLFHKILIGFYKSPSERAQSYQNTRLYYRKKPQKSSKKFMVTSQMRFLQTQASTRQSFKTIVNWTFFGEVKAKKVVGKQKALREYIFQIKNLLSSNVCSAKLYFHPFCI